MLSKCANPGCSASFLYLHEGKLFRFDTDFESAARPKTEKTARRVEFFWLCGECAAQFTLRYEKGVGVTTVPAPEMQVRSASAS
jgi:hypothetical protein